MPIVIWYTLSEGGVKERRMATVFIWCRERRMAPIIVWYTLGEGGVKAGRMMTIVVWYTLGKGGDGEGLMTTVIVHSALREGWRIIWVIVLGITALLCIICLRWKRRPVSQRISLGLGLDGATVIPAVINSIPWV